MQFEAHFRVNHSTIGRGIAPSVPPSPVNPLVAAGAVVRQSNDRTGATMPAEAPRTVLQTVGNYDLLEKIAEGGMGTVYRGRDRTSGQVVAVKLVSPQMASNEVFRQRFEKEYN